METYENRGTQMKTHETHETNGNTRQQTKAQENKEKHTGNTFKQTETTGTKETNGNK